MSNRASRRVVSKGHTGRITPRGVRPVGNKHGVEIDVADHIVFTTFHSGEVTITFGWLGNDAIQIAEMLVSAGRQAIDGIEKSPIVERESGLVVARTIPSA